MMCTPPWYGRDVSRETLEALGEYAALIRKWTPKINLISPASVHDLESRHLWDSAQLFNGEVGLWVDLGSGGGLPGIVVSILKKGEGNLDRTVLIESDQRKSTFLRTCARELGLNISVLTSRVEQTPAQSAAVLSARAFAPLTVLLNHAERHLGPKGVCVFPKGARWQAELEAAQKDWLFSYEADQSKTCTEASVLKIRNIERV